MDEFDRAQAIEQQDRELALQQHRARTETTVREDCADCEEPLEHHRRQYGTCIECQTDREKRSKLYRQD